MDKLWSSMPSDISYSSLLRCCFHSNWGSVDSKHSRLFIAPLFQLRESCYSLAVFYTADDPSQADKRMDHFMWNLLQLIEDYLWLQRRVLLSFFAKGSTSLPVIHLFNKSWLRASLYAPLYPVLISAIEWFLKFSCIG